MSYTYFNISDKLRLYEFEGLLDQYGDATAAYSLRKLRNDYTGSAIRVRRSSDDAERDMGFYDNELDTVALLDWVNQDVIQYTSNFSATTNGWAGQGGTADGNIDGIDGQDDCLRLTVDTSTGNHRLSNSTLFDDRPNSFRIELDYYIPSSNIDANSIRILTSGNDTGFLDVLDTWTSATLDTGQVPSGYFYITMYASGTNLFTGNGADVIYVKNIRVTQTSSNGLVQTWYDQSANANHAVQNTDTAQPKIVDAGTLVTEGGKPAIIYDGVDDHFSDLSGVMGGSVNGLMLSVHKTNDGTTTPDVAQISSANPISIPIVGNNQVSYAHLTNTRRIFATSDNFYNRQILVSRQNYNSDHALYIDGDLIDSQTDTVNYTDVLKIGRVKAGATFLYFNNNMQELIVFNSNESTTRPDIETNINTYYSIY